MKKIIREKRNFKNIVRNSVRLDKLKILKRINIWVSKLMVKFPWLTHPPILLNIKEKI